jgi:Carboxypeptidase regulatory-like domain
MGDGISRTTGIPLQEIPRIRLSRKSNGTGQIFHSYGQFEQQQRVEELLRWRLAYVLIVFLCFCVPTFAQTGNATLSGRVTDKSKAIIVGARVVVTNVDTSVSRETKTNSDGNYTVGSLPPGSYKVEIDKTGFENIEERHGELLSKSTLSRCASVL